MAGTLKRQYLMLKPMVAGANGFARLEIDGDYVLLQLTCKDLLAHAHGLRVFFYAGEGTVQELGHASVNAQGQATFTTDLAWRELSLSPGRLQALLVVSDEAAPKPLLLGLCTQQSAGSLMDAKNAILALCEKLALKGERAVLRPPESAPSPSWEGPPFAVANPPAPPARKASAFPVPTSSAPTAAAAPRTPARSASAHAAPSPIPKDSPPREVFLSAIDPKDYLFPSQSPEAPAETRPARQRGDRPVDRLRPLVWPARFRELPAYFDRYAPMAPFDLPGWRFARVPMVGGGYFAIGRFVTEGRVSRVAYAVPGSADQPPPKPLSRYRFYQGREGQGYWVLGQEVR